MLWLLLKKGLYMPSKVSKFIYLCIILGTISFALYTAIFKNGNYVHEYITRNNDVGSYRLYGGNEYEEEIIVSNSYMRLKGLVIPIEDVCLSDGDSVKVTFAGNEYEYRNDIFDALDGLSIPIDTSNEKELLRIEILGDSNSWIDISKNSQTRNVYIEKTYYVDQLEDNHILFYLFVSLLVICVLYETIVLVFKAQVFADKRNFFVVSAIIFFSICLRDITLVINPQEFAEQIGTAFYFGTRGTLWQAATTPEAGYSALGKRLIGWFVCKTEFGRIHFVGITNLLVALASALSCGMIANYAFCKENAYESRIVGFLVAIYIPIIALACDSNYLFIDIGYWGFIYILLLWLKGDEYKRSSVGYFADCLIIAIICMTQGHFVMFIPVALVHLLVSRSKTRFVDIAVIIGGGGQMFFSLRANAVGIWLHNETAIQFAKGVLRELGKVSLRVWGITPNNRVSIYLGVVETLILVVIFAVTCMRWVKKRDEDLISSAILIGLIGVEIIFLAITSPTYLESRYLKSRYEMFLIVTIVLLEIKFFTKLVKKEQLVIMGIAVLMIIGTRDELIYDYYNAWSVTTRIGDWKHVAERIEKNDSYFIKLDPLNWTYKNYNYRASEEVASATPLLELNECRDVFAVYAMNNDISRNIVLRIYDNENVIHEYEKVSPDIKEYMTFYFERIDDVNRIEFYDKNSNELLHMEDVCVCYIDDDYEFVLRP